MRQRLQMEVEVEGSARGYEGEVLGSEGGISICQNSKTCIKTLRNNLDFFIKQNNKTEAGNETNF